MIDIKNELEDIIPTYDADVDVVGLLKDSTSLGTDDDGNEIPGYIFAKDISDMLELPEIELAKFALKNGYEILSAKVVGEEIPSEMLVICRKGFDQDILKTDYKEIFDLELELTSVESFDDISDDEKSDEKKLGEDLNTDIKYRVHYFSYKAGREIVEEDGLTLEEAEKAFKRAIERLKNFNLNMSFKDEFIVVLDEDTEYFNEEIIKSALVKRSGKVIYENIENKVKQTISEAVSERTKASYRHQSVKEEFFSDKIVDIIQNKIEAKEKLSDALPKVSSNDLYKCLGWLTLNITNITAEIPVDVKDSFIKRFGDVSEEIVKFRDINDLDDYYNLSSFEKSVTLKLVSSYKCPKELKTLINEEANEIYSFTLAKVLIKVYGFKFGENSLEENSEKVRKRLMNKETSLKSFESGFALVNIEKNERALDDIIAHADEIVKQNAEDWLCQHVKRVFVEVPDFMLNRFNYLFSDAVLGKHYKVVDNRVRTDGGHLKKWALGATLSVDTTDGAPTWLLPYFKGNQIKGNTEMVLSLVHKYGFDFGKNSEKKITESIQDIKPGTKIKLNKDTFYADIEVEGMFEDDENLLDEFLDSGFILKGTELFIPAGSVLILVASQSVDLYEFNGLQFEVSEWPEDVDYTIVNENVVEANELETRAKKHKKTDKKGARGWFVNPNEKLTHDSLKDELLSLEVFCDNEYLENYINLILTNKSDLKESETLQTHHIIPRSFYKLTLQEENNSKINKVNLSYKDHILAHYYLALCSVNEHIKNANELALKFMLNDSYDKNLDVETFKNSLDKFQELREDFELRNKNNPTRFIKGQIPYNKGKEMSEEQKFKLSESHRGKQGTFLGKKHSEESKLKMSSQHQGKKLSDEHKQKLTELRPALVLTSHTEEANIKRSQTLKGHVISEETRKKIAKSLKNRKYHINPNAGNVEQNIARANHMMGDGSVASNITVGSAPAGLGEEVELSEMLPHKDESKTDFVARFMSDDKMIKEYENPKQRYAVAMSYWEKK